MNATDCLYKVKTALARAMRSSTARERSKTLSCDGGNRLESSRTWRVHTLMPTLMCVCIDSSGLRSRSNGTIISHFVCITHTPPRLHWRVLRVRFMHPTPSINRVGFSVLHLRRRPWRWKCFIHRLFVPMVQWPPIFYLLRS